MMEDLERDDLRLASNATFVVVALSALFWIWLFSQGLFSVLIHAPDAGIALLVPIVGVSLSIILPLWLQRVGRARWLRALSSAWTAHSGDHMNPLAEPAISGNNDA